MAARKFSRSPLGRSRDGDGDRLQLAESPREETQGNRIYIGNMLYTAQRNDVEAVLRAAGFEFANIDISIDLFTSRNPSYCFVDLRSSEDAENAMRILPGKDLRGRPLKVKPCVQKRAVDSRPHSILLQFTRWSDRSRLNSQWRRQDPTVAASSANLLIPMQQGRRLFIGGLPKPTDNHTSDLVIRELFKDFTVEAVSKAKSPTKESLRGNGWYAFVDLNTVEEAQRAIRQLHGISMWGGNLTVNLAKRNPGKVLEAIAREREQETEMGRGKGREHAPWRSNATETSVFKAVPS